MAGFVRITLLAPHVAEYPEADIPLRFGQESVVPMQSSIEQDPSTYVQAYKNSASNARAIEYTLNWSDESRRDVLVPEDCAKLYFGDWTLPQVQHTFIPGSNTFAREKQRVALKWGDYLYRTPDRGQEFTQDIIAPPNVPKVIIQRVDQGGRVVGDWKFDPWAYYAWDKDVNPRAVARERAKEAEFAPKPAVHDEASELAALKREFAALKAQMKAKA